MVSFRIDWFDPLAVRGTLQSLLQRHSGGVCIGPSLLIIAD